MTIRAVGTQAVPARPASPEWLGWEELDTRSLSVSALLWLPPRSFIYPGNTWISEEQGNDLEPF